MLARQAERVRMESGSPKVKHPKDFSGGVVSIMKVM